MNVIGVIRTKMQDPATSTGIHALVHALIIAVTNPLSASHQRIRKNTEITDQHGAAQPQPNNKLPFASEFSTRSGSDGVISRLTRSLPLPVLSSVAYGNSCQESKNSLISIMEQR